MLHLVGLPRAGAPLICFTGAEIAGLGEWLQFEYIEPSEFQRLWRRHPVPARTRASSHPACLSSTIRRPPGGQAWSWRRRRGRRVARGPAEVMRAFVSNRRSMAESDQGISEDRQDPKRVARRRTHKTTGWACAGSQRHIQACDRPGGTRPHGFEVVARQRAFVGCDCDRQTSWQAADDRPDLGQGKRRRIHRRRDGRESSGVDRHDRARAGERSRRAADKQAAERVDGAHYQLANRIAWTLWLRGEGIDAVFAYVVFDDDRSHIPATRDELVSEAHGGFEALGLSRSSGLYATVALPATR